MKKLQRLTKIENKGVNGYPIYTGSYGNVCNLGDNRCTSCVHAKLGPLEDIEDELGIELIKVAKALVIIKEKRVNVGYLLHDIEEHFMKYEEYLENFDYYQDILIPLTQEEFDSLKEVFGLCI